MCTCNGIRRCGFHMRLDQARHEVDHTVSDDRQRMTNNRLDALAKDFDITDAQWCALIYLHEVDDLHLLLTGGGEPA